MAESPWESLLVAATAAHAAFQLTVTALVYPALAEVPGPDWAQAHRRHSRRILPLVGAVYGGVVVTSVAALAARPSRTTLVAALASATSLGTTAAVAAPLHTRLGAGRDPVLLARLRRADRVRTAGAVVAFAAAVVQLGRASPVASSFSRSSTRES